MLLSTPLLLEYEAVLTRPAVLAMASVSTEEVLAVLDELAGVCVPVAFDYRWRPQARDPDDDLVLDQYIATALVARVGAQAEAERYFAARAAI